VRKICVVTGTRAEYGLLRWVMQGIRDSGELQLQVIATGMHLSPEFGLTYREIEADGFRIDRKVEMLLSSDTPSGVSKSMGLGMIGFSDALDALRPDMVLLLGDRFEIFAAAAAAMVMRVPIAHLHGGESTEGLIDEAIRHSITKMSQLHFVAAREYRDRVVQLGEDPSRVFLVGGLGVDSLRHTALLSRADLEQSLGVTFRERNLLVTFHAVTLEDATAAEQMRELTAALESFPDSLILFTMPNSDPDGRALFAIVNEFVESHDNAYVFTSLGQTRYFSCVDQVDGVVGNSSSGLAEVPSFRTGTVDIGDRQRGRLKAPTVISCVPERTAIVEAIRRLYSPDFQQLIATSCNPYGDGGAADRIVSVLRDVDLSDILKKAFFDVPVP
jgi:GDP/UDP-N,N'-diacetylbacillosamine 2-epimerase (hydrolysing)